MINQNVYINYLPILIFFAIAVGIAVVLSLAGKILSRFVRSHKPSKSKNDPFECGFSEFDDARAKFDVRFYLVAILFLIFDLEVAFVLPWGIQLKSYAGSPVLSTAAFTAMMMFLLILFAGFIYEWKKGALEWE